MNGVPATPSRREWCGWPAISADSALLGPPFAPTRLYEGHTGQAASLLLPAGEGLTLHYATDYMSGVGSLQVVAAGG